MHPTIMRAALWAAASIALVAAPVAAHENRAVGQTEIVVGWLTEPAFADAVNGVSFRVSDAEGPVTGARLKVDVKFGSEAEVLTLTLSPVFRDPGHYKAEFVPTRAGAYTFHVYGTFDGKAFDQTFTSGPKTFDEITSSADLQFPKKDPSRGELADKAVAVDRRIAALKVRANKAKNKADLAYGVAALALVWLALPYALRKRRAK